MKKMILFAHGYDVPGVGASITQVLYERNCRILDFKMITLEKCFSLMICISSKDYFDASELEAAIKHSTVNFEVNIKLFGECHPPSLMEKEQAEWIPYKITIYCDDRSEILFYFMKEMSRLNINIADIHCRHSETEDNQNQFEVLVKIEVPVSISTENLKANLNEIAAHLNILIDFSPIENLEL
ncbi:MAG: hypothetical protein JW774_08265 [Candidatus Aureabacteria bacterium]|nr:hypothetical protein [Candidatus Auribacterota bacterium]